MIIIRIYADERGEFEFLGGRNAIDVERARAGY